MMITRRSFFTALAVVPIVGRLIKAAPGKDQPIVTSFDDYWSWEPLRFAEVGTQFTILLDGVHYPAMVTKHGLDLETMSAEVEWTSIQERPTRGWQHIPPVTGRTKLPRRPRLR